MRRGAIRRFYLDSELWMCSLQPLKILDWLVENLEQELKLGRTFDLVFSYEVAEHIHPDAAQNFIRSLINHYCNDRCRSGTGRRGALQ